MNNIKHPTNCIADEHNIYIGITHRDICRDDKNGVKDLGVLESGRGWPRFSFILRLFPLSKDSTQCLINDAKSKADFNNKHNLCG